MGAAEDRDEGGRLMPDVTNRANTWASNNSFEDWLRRALKGYGQGMYNDKATNFYNQAGVTGANTVSRAGANAGIIGMGSLTNMLYNQGRVDPRMLAAAQAQNARGTQGIQDNIQGQASRSGMSGSGLYKALNAAAGSAGANRASNLNYQDMVDSYQRQQQNLGLLNELVLNKQRDYGAIGAGQYGVDKAASTNDKAAKYQAVGGLIGGIAGMFCRVAKELYGEDSPKFHRARAYVMTKTPADVSVKYAMHSDEIVNAMRTDPKLRERMTKTFDRFAEMGGKAED
jgi:hypothetical protein